MTTIAAGTSAQLYVPLESSLTITPGAGGLVDFGCSGNDAPSPRLIYAAETITIPAGATVFMEARGASATYTDPNMTAAQLTAVQAADTAGVLDITAAQTTALQSLVSGGELRVPFDIAARTAASLAAQGYVYYAPLTHDIRPIVGSALPVHTRAAAATVVDYAGRMHFCLSGEVRFRGARRVANLIADSEGWGGWTPGTNTTNVAAATSFRCIGPRRSARTIARTSGSAVMMTLASAAYRPGPYVFSFGMESATAQTIRVRIERTSDTATVAEVDIAAPAGGMFRYAVGGTITDTTNHRVTITNTTSGASTIYVNCAMLTYGDELHEYQARGVAGAAAPFDGAGVDGVRYYPYVSGCTYSATTGAVTDSGPGAAIPDSTLAGVLLCPLATAQRFWQSRDVGDVSAWTHTGMTVGGLSSCTLLGYQSLRQMTADTSTGLHTISQVWRLTVTDSRVLSVSFYLDPATCPEWVYVGFLAHDATTTYRCWINTRTRAIGSKTGGTTTYISGYCYMEGDLLRVGMSAPSLTGGTAPVGFLGFANGDAVTSYTGSGETAKIGAAQFEFSDCPGPYIADQGGSGATTTVSETFIYPRLTILPSAEWGMTMEVTPDVDCNADGKTSWYYFAYWYLDTNNRGGITVRPGQYAGSTYADRRIWPMDYYSAFGGTEIHTFEADVAVRQRLRMAARLTRSVGADSAQVAWAMDGTLSAVASGHTSAAGAVIADTVIDLYFWQSGVSGNAARAGKGTVRKFGIQGYAPTNAQLQTISAQ